MEQEQTAMHASIDEYIELFREVMDRAGDDSAAAVIVEQIGKDKRMAQIHAFQRGNGGVVNGDDVPATQKQLAYMKRLGLTIPDGLTKKEASDQIDAALATQ